MYNVEKGFLGLGGERIKCWNCDNTIYLNIQGSGGPGINIAQFATDTCPHCGSKL